MAAAPLTHPSAAAREEALLVQLRELERPLRDVSDLDALLERIGDARYVLLGEASHGTAEYYAWRAALTTRLIEEKSFSFIAVEGDWPDCQRVNRFVQGLGDPGASAREVLRAFERWPTWLWANLEVTSFAERLREYNLARPAEQRVGFYGLDVYSLWESLDRVLGYLRERRPRALASALRAFECLEPYGEDVERYARAVRWIDESCEDEVISLLAELRRSPPEQPSAGDARLDAEQNALVVKNAEHYYRTLIGGGAQSWNIRDHHMAETLERLMMHHGPQAKVVVWEHNTHIGDARFTDMATHGMVNLGQLMREWHGAPAVVLVGFGSFRGTVIAGREWGAQLQRMRVPPAAGGSWEALLHRALARDCWLLPEPSSWTAELLEPRLQRAIGVVYRPEYEQGNYVPSVLPRRYDAFLYFERSEALHPLHEVQPRSEGEVPETFPSGM
jgi:erythromycin esterase